MNVTVGNKLKKIRKIKGLSQEEIASSLQLSQSTYARIERGESGSWACHINKICEIFDISPEDLIKVEMAEDKEERKNLIETSIISQLSNKMIEQYEARIKELKKVIKDLKRKRNL